jgi:lipid A 3-O-deacylase
MHPKHINTPIRSLAFAAAFFAIALPAAAEGWRPDGYFVQGGIGGRSIWNASVGLAWPWTWKASLLGTEVGGVTEAYIGHWDAPKADGGRRGFTQIGLVPMFRFRLDQGRSPWFAEAVIGISGMDQHFVTTDKQFTTSFNFVDVLGVGRSFGAGRGQEIGVRLQHVSNAGIRVPNPGQNFLQLRYGVAF